MEYNLTMTTKELQAWRKKNGYSQSQLAKVLGVTSLTISRWERGDRKIPSFLALTLKCLERKGDELKTKGTKMKKEREVKK